MDNGYIVKRLFSLKILGRCGQMHKIIGNIKGQNILFLQGPLGGFFEKLGHYFQAYGAKTYQICFNAGDAFFAQRDNRIYFREPLLKWASFFRKVIIDNAIDRVFLFGDCRIYHRIALRVAEAMNVECYVFEEGYIRPDFISLEKHGVNDFTNIPRQRSFYEKIDPTVSPLPEIIPAENDYAKSAVIATCYYILMQLFSFRYPHYEHHREKGCIKQAFWGIRNAYRKIFYQLCEGSIHKKIDGTWSQKFYFVPLQTYNDFQIRMHSPYNSVEAFIEEVMISFYAHAPKDTYLLFKHHPADRGKKNYTFLIRQLASNLSMSERVIVTHDVHIPTCLKNALGTITINSTVGVSSLFHKTPTITLGRAVYDIDGLTCHGMSLKEFWRNRKTPDMSLFRKFRYYLIDNTQLNGGFFGHFPAEWALPAKKYISSHSHNIETNSTKLKTV
jgi:capsular polysaccharide export protein